MKTEVELKKEIEAAVAGVAKDVAAMFATVGFRGPVVPFPTPRYPHI
jgi:hypothetical protein